MQHFDLHPQFYNKVIMIPEEDATGIIKRFFEDNQLHEVRQQLWNLFEVAITTDNNLYEEAKHRSDLLYFYSQFEMLVEAAFVLSKYIL